jgi:uncharacterized membrane protein
MSEEQPGNGSVRLAGFSDAVVAIAITLVVLPLVESARDVTHESAETFFHDNRWAFVAAAISFGAIGRLWREHHRLYLRATGSTEFQVRLNLLWLSAVMFVPVATVLEVSISYQNRLVSGCYVGAVLVAMLVIRLEELELRRAHLLVHEDAFAAWTRWLPAAATALAFISVLVVPAASLWGLVLVPISDLVARALRALHPSRRA